MRDLQDKQDNGQKLKAGKFVKETIGDKSITNQKPEEKRTNQKNAKNKVGKKDFPAQ